jgi:hypothetical protein
MAGGPSPRIPPSTFPPRGLSRPHGPGADSTGSQIRASLAALSGRTGRADLRAEDVRTTGRERPAGLPGLYDPKCGNAYGPVQPPWGHSPSPMGSLPVCKKPLPEA